RGRTVALDDEDGLLEQHLHRLQAARGRNLGEISLVEIAGADEVQDSAIAAAPLPWLDRRGAQVPDVEILDDRNALSLRPFLVGTLWSDRYGCLSFEHANCSALSDCPSYCFGKSFMRRLTSPFVVTVKFQS